MTQPSKIKILFILPSLSAGGAERVISFVSQNIDPDKFHPVLLVAGFEKDTVWLHSLNSVWAALSFIVPKKTGDTHVVTDLCELNKWIVRKPYPLPKIPYILQKMERLTLLFAKVEWLHLFGNQPHFSPKRFNPYTFWENSTERKSSNNNNGRCM